MFDAATSPEDNVSNGSGQAPAQKTLYLKIYSDEFQFVWNNLRRLGVSESDLADVTHDVFMTVHGRLDTYDRTRPVRPWLFGILYRVAMDNRRLSRHTREILPGEGHGLEREDPRPRPDEALFDRQAREVAARVLDKMDPRLRMVLVMCDIGERPANEIATSLGIPVKTVYTRLRLARARFAAAVERMAGPSTI
jgi:RNA polymerase sigma-70 factor, ECF subfamily